MLLCKWKFEFHCHDKQQRSTDASFWWFVTFKLLVMDLKLWQPYQLSAVLFLLSDVHIWTRIFASLTTRQHAIETRAIHEAIALLPFFLIISALEIHLIWAMRGWTKSASHAIEFSNSGCAYCLTDLCLISCKRSNQASKDNRLLFCLWFTIKLIII